MNYPMHPELKIGNKFPDFELPDQTGTPHKLSHLLRGFPIIDPKTVAVDELRDSFWPRLSLLAPQRGRFMSRLKAADPLLGLLGRPNQIQLL